MLDGEGYAVNALCKQSKCNIILILCQNSLLLSAPKYGFWKLPFMCELPFIASGVIKDEVT